MIHKFCSTYLSLQACSFLFQSSQVVTPICFKLCFWWWTLPSESTRPFHLPLFLPHVLIPLLHFICYTLSSEIIKLLHIIILVFWNTLKKMKKKRKRSKVKRKREIRSYKKENKWEHLYLYLHYHLHHLPYPSSSTSLGSIIIISGTFFDFIIHFVLSAYLLLAKSYP